MENYFLFLKENNIFDKNLIDRLFNFHIRFLNSNKCNAMWAKSILQNYSFNFDTNIFKTNIEYVSFLIKGNYLNKCEICGNPIEYKFHLKRKYCIKCMKKYYEIHHNDIIEKKKQTSLKHYGVEFPAQSKEIKEKIKQNCLQKFGVEYFLQNKEIREKIKQTCIKKYGKENFSQSNKFKEKYKETCIEKYGVEHAFKANSIKEKIKNTFIKKYGVNNPLKCKVIKEKQRNSMIARYGEEVLHTENTFKEYKKTCLKKYEFENYKLFDAWNHLNNLEDYKPMFLKNEFIGNDHIYKWKCKHCNNEFTGKYDNGKVIGGCPLCLKGRFNI